MKNLTIMFLIFFLAAPGYAEENKKASKVIVLDPISVTPMRYDEFESRTPASTYLITPEDIKNSGAQTTIDLLRPVPGVVVRDWTGNGTSASVDVRGFGEQAGLNVAVLVDGRKVNEVDISGTDWTQIPIGVIDRIEIIRGGAGGVLYGDNAVSGVINIITKSGQGKPYLEYEEKFGSYRPGKIRISKGGNLMSPLETFEDMHYMHEERVSIGGELEGLDYFVTAGNKGSTGYRDNSYYKNMDIASKLGYEVTTDFHLKFSQSWQKEEYGLPGALSSRDQGRFNREYSAFAEDYAKGIDYNFVGGFDAGLWGWGELSSDFSFRRRDTYSYFIGANAGWNPILRSKIDTVGITPKYVLDKDIFGFGNNFITGLDFYRHDSNYNTFNINSTIQNLTAINKTTLGWYAQDSFFILPNLNVVGGYRYEWAEYEFDYIDVSGSPWANPPLDDKLIKIARAYNIGVVYEFVKGMEVFFDYNQSFRFPATDEYFSWGAIDMGLKQQESRNYEEGIRIRIKDKFKGSISSFWMNVDNELYYNPTGGAGGFGANENYGKTRHQGIEISADAEIVKNVNIFGNYTFTDATFRDGVYKKKRIPMVPVNKGSAGARITFLEYFTFNILGTYVGDRFFINDQANNFPELKGYFTVDASLFFRYKDLSIGGGVNNIFNEKFYEYGVRNATTGAANFYPANGVNFFLQGKYKFR